MASGSVAGAATNLGYTPSTVSQHITALARETGLTLFVPDGRGIRPTAAATRLVAATEDLMHNLSALDSAVAEIRDGKQGSLTIGAFSSAAQAWIPTVLKSLRHEYPDLVFNLLLNELDENSPTAARTDLDLRSEPVQSPLPTPRGYTRGVLSSEDYVVFLHRRHPLADRRQIDFAELAGEPWLQDNPCMTCARIVSEACDAAGFVPRYVARADDHHTALAFVAAGIGLTMLPRLVLATTVPADVVAVPVTNPAPRRNVVAWVRNATRDNPAQPAPLRRRSEQRQLRIGLAAQRRIPSWRRGGRPVPGRSRRLLGAPLGRQRTGFLA